MASTGDTLVRRAVIAAAVMAAAAVGMALALGSSQQSEAQAVDAEHCRAWAKASTERAAVVVGHGRRVVVMGDSYTRGYGLADPDRSWPSDLADPLRARVFVDGFDGSGFTDGNGCGVPYRTRVGAALARRPALVVAEGGLNDAYLSDADLRSGVRALVRGLAGTRLVVVGPPRTPTIGARAARVDRTLSEMAAPLGFEYVRTYGWSLPYLSDGVHLTEAGHRRFASRVAVAVNHVGWSQPAGGR